MIGLLSLFLFAIPEKFDGSHMATYNSLPEVELADTAIKARPDFSTFLENFGDLIRRHGLEDAVGLRLVHRHFPLETKADGKQAVMSESFELVEGVPSLVTKAHEVTSTLLDSYPASWLFTESEEQGIPFELSSDSAIKTARDRIDAATGFFDDARQMIVRDKYASLLSLAILKRTSLTSDDDQQVLNEKSREGIGSILQLVHITEVQTEENIQTSWVFADTKGPKQVGCTKRMYCARDPMTGNHPKKPYHDRQDN